MKEEEEEWSSTNIFLDPWETLPHSNNRHSPPPPSSSSSSSSSPSSTHFSPLQIFPPVNHEDLPIPIPIPQPTLPIPSCPPPRNTQFLNWVHFALRWWNSKLISNITQIRLSGFFSFFRLAGIGGSILGVLWFWVRWRRGAFGRGRERVKQLTLIINEKDEKIVRLLEQISEMNKALLTRYRIPVLNPS